MKRKVVTVSDVNRYVNRLLGEDYVLSNVWIAGEVSNCKYHHTGHIYFTLKDDAASINVVMFAKEASHLTFKVTEGMRIYAQARIALYEKTGNYQAYLSQIEKQGVGTLYEAFEKLKHELSQEGLFAQEHKQRLPEYPTRVGVITSQTGAAIKDIIHVAKRRNPSIPLYIYPVHVQGTHAKTEIVEAIEKANQQAKVDVLILGRGGGSIEDLWAFNEACVAQAIFKSKIPIVSAVGHEVDFTISDFVADVRAATPSAAAEQVIPERASCLRQIEEYKMRAHAQLIYTLKRQQEAIIQLMNRPIYRHKEQVIHNKLIEVISQTDKLQRNYRYSIEKQQYALSEQVHKLESLSPLKTLTRGYALVTKVTDDTLVTRTEQLEIGDQIKITLADGFMTGRIEEKG